MDWSSFIVPACIVLYGFWEYWRRERLHARRLADLERGVELSFGHPRPALLQVISSGTVAVLLLAMTGWLVYMEARTGRIFGAFGQVAAFFGLLFFVVFALFIAALLRYRRKG